MVLKLTKVWRFGVNTSSLTAVLRMRIFISMMLSGGVPNNVPTAVEMGPPLETIKTSPLCCDRTWAMASWMPCTNSVKGGMPVGWVSARIHACKPLRNKPKWCLYRSGVLGLAKGSGWMAWITAWLSYSFRPGHTKG